MKIAHIIWTFYVGGIQTMLIDIVNEQVKNNDVRIFVLNHEIDNSQREKLDKRIQLIDCGRIPGSRNPLPLLKLNFHLMRFRPDVIHCHEDGITKTFLTVAPMIRTIHNVHSKPLEYAKFQALCCISKSVKCYTGDQGYPNSIVVYNGIHTELIRKRTQPIRDSKQKLRIVCVGRLHPMKGQELLVDGVNVLVHKRQITDFCVDLIGDGECHRVLEEKVEEYNLQSYFNFLGAKDRNYIYEHLADYDLFVMTSVSEGFGLTLAEACAAKIPVLTSDLEGPMEVIDNGKYGRYFNSGDAKSLADSLQEVLNSTVNVSQINGAYDYVVNNFNVVSTANKYLTIYESILNNDKK